jgi:RNA polymerase sigma factor for flagellar operon FliA
MGRIVALPEDPDRLKSTCVKTRGHVQSPAFRTLASLPNFVGERASNCLYEGLEVVKMTAAAQTVDLRNPSTLIANFSAEERDALILEHLPQVRMIARRIHARLPEYVRLDDLVSTGTLGLISAIDRFDRSRNLRLKTYAEHKIKGAILDSLRRLDWAPRQQRKRAKQIEAAIAMAEQRLQRAPTEEEIAAELNLTVDGYRHWQLEIGGVNLARLESAGSEDSEDRNLLRFVSGDPNELPYALLERRELQTTLAAAISGIPPIEQTVLGLYYHDELTLREIAKIVGLHESRISQLKTQAILRLRVCMAELWPATGHRPIPPAESTRSQAA